MASRRRLIATQTSHVDSNGMITDSWDTFISIVKSGRARQYYELGNYIPLNLGEHGTLNMGILAFDPIWLEEDLSRYPNIALFSKECLNDTYTLTDLAQPSAIVNRRIYNPNIIYHDVIPSYLPEWLLSSIVPVYRHLERDGSIYGTNLRTENLYHTWTLVPFLDVGYRDLTQKAGCFDIEPLKSLVQAKVKANGEIVQYWAFSSVGWQNTDETYYCIINVVKADRGGAMSFGISSKNTSLTDISGLGFPLGFCL